jgi:hypothetical protein
VLSLLFFAFVALIAVPTALGAKPIKTEFQPQPFVIPAGFGCAFDVGVADEDARATIMQFSDGRVAIHGHAEPTVMNLETGDSFAQRTRGHITRTFDPEANELLFDVTGRLLLNLYPGDQGPFGEVGEDGLVASVIGHQRFTLDLDTEVTTSYSLDGQAIDVCPLISG